MSLYASTTQACPNCGAENTFDAFFSVNADRRPDLRDEILTQEFMTVSCATCDAAFRLEPDLNYLDLGRKTWIRAKPVFSLDGWGAVEQEASADFREAFGGDAPAAAREIGDTLAPRLTFGWPAFREKIVAGQAGLDDVALELTKLAILRLRDGNPVEPGVELCLLDARSDTLLFAWVETAGGEEREFFEAKRELYDAVRDDAEWAAFGQRLSEGLFVDYQRLFLDPAPAQPGDEMV